MQLNFSSFKTDAAAVTSAVFITTGIAMISAPAAFIFIGLVFGALAYFLARNES